MKIIDGTAETLVKTACNLGDVIEPLKRGIISKDQITDLFELSQCKNPGRRNDKEITVFKSGGGGHDDLATALMLYERFSKA